MNDKTFTPRLIQYRQIKARFTDDRAEMWRKILRPIADVDIANMTPVQALNLLNEMQMEIQDWARYAEE